MTVTGREYILVLNAGSSSLKFKIFDRSLTARLSGAVSNIGLADASMQIGGAAVSGEFSSHKGAIRAVLGAIEAQGYAARELLTVGHRVVHGGALLTEPAIVTADSLAKIRDCAELAPLHNPHNLAGIEAVAELCPEIEQVACFDTAFHATNSDLAVTYALPHAVREEGNRRFGFHGLSFEAITARLPELSAGPLPERILALHLGNGASVCAIKNGKSVATSMGYSPLDGLTMGTRAGSLDPGLVLKLAAGPGGAEAASQLLNQQSGLLGLSGRSSDMAELLARYETDEKSRFAVDHFCYWAARHSASVTGAMQGLDAIVFTGGIGEHAALVRSKIAGHLSWLGAAIDEEANQLGAARLHDRASKAGVWIVKADEEQQIARHAAGFFHPPADQR